MRLKGIVLVALLLVAGCASRVDRDVVIKPPIETDRPNGSPGWLPCMIGDALCQKPHGIATD